MKPSILNRFSLIGFWHFWDINLFFKKYYFTCLVFFLSLLSISWCKSTKVYWSQKENSAVSFNDTFFNFPVSFFQRIIKIISRTYKWFICIFWKGIIVKNEHILSYLYLNMWILELYDGFWNFIEYHCMPVN